jgi:taurine transport system ATP-binding protein
VTPAPASAGAAAPDPHPAHADAPAHQGRSIALRGVHHRYETGTRSVDALGPVDLEIPAGEFVTIVGPSGCGKSTLLSLVAGFTKPTDGVVLVGDEPVAKPDPSRGVVFQQPNLFPWYSVRDNVALGPRMAGASRAEQRALGDEFLALVGLAEYADAKPYELSGGQQQRAQIARVLAGDPDVMLLDEPFGALDALTRERLQHELHSIWLRSRQTAIFITHGVDEAAFLGTRVIVMSPRPGQIVFDERPPFPIDGRTPELRASAEFGAFRNRVRDAIIAQLVDNEPLLPAD